MIRKHAICTGRVQGVGFRYFVTGIATQYQLTGWVRNCYDGSVELEVQGPPSIVAFFFAKIKEGNRYIRVDDIDITNRPLIAPEKEKKFIVTY